MIIVIGLGNPGKEYAGTRHNVGFSCIDGLARLHRVALNQRRAHAVYGEGSIEGQPVVLAKPRTYVNRSGLAARYLLDRYRQPPSSLLVVYDDMDLPLGEIRLRPQGSAGGHNGLKSIIAELGTQEFPRLRIGIGHPPESDAVDHVLGAFSAQERAVARKTLDVAMEAVAWVAARGLDAAMNRFNQKQTLGNE
ncbi:MAG: aminoacyl-tRNA hydrolase [Chloroflexi bacterium]|nr:aminoacyl-tRNA hydrolase [Chloroflexota bacterium]